MSDLPNMKDNRPNMKDIARLYFQLPVETRLSMVSGNGVAPAVNRSPSYRPYRKMADIGVQWEEPQDSNLCPDAANYSSTVAEINTCATDITTSAQIAELDTPNSVFPRCTSHRPLSLQNSTSSSNSSEGRQRPSHEEQDVDAICVQQSAVDEEKEKEESPGSSGERSIDKTETDGFVIQEKEKEESDCALDCLTFMMRCCECTIL